MTPVNFRFLTPEGKPLADAVVEIHLAGTGVFVGDTGVVVPADVTYRTDTEGELTVELAPSEHMYHALVHEANGLDLAARYSFLVPELEPPATSVRFQDILVTGALPEKPYDEAALLEINEARANAVSAALAAEAALAQLVPLLFQNSGSAISGPITAVNFVGFTVAKVGNTLVVTAPEGNSGPSDSETPEGTLSVAGLGSLLFNNNLLVLV